MRQEHEWAWRAQGGERGESGSDGYKQAKRVIVVQMGLWPGAKGMSKIFLVLRMFFFNLEI